MVQVWELGGELDDGPKMVKYEYPREEVVELNVDENDADELLDELQNVLDVLLNEQDELLNEHSILDDSDLQKQAGSLV